MNPLRVVGGAEFEAKKARDSARKHARPYLHRWEAHVRELVKARRLPHAALAMAEELTNYPSANEGRCYAGQKRLGAAIGRSDRTARGLLRQMRDVGALATKRGGPGRTAAWIFCIAGVPILGIGAGQKMSLINDRLSETGKLSPTKDSLSETAKKGRKRTLSEDETPEVSAQDRQEVAGLDRQEVADKPFEPDPIEHNPPPFPPKQIPTTHHNCLTFDGFWQAAMQQSDPGRPGPALALWSSLSAADIRGIERLVGPQGINLDGMHASVWIKARRWESPPLRVLKADGAELQTRSVFEELRPYSPEWNVERERLAVAQQRSQVRLMDYLAKGGRSWTRRREQFAGDRNKIPARPHPPDA